MGNSKFHYASYHFFLLWSDGKWLKFFYDGSGKLLKRQNSAGDAWEYLSGMIFKNGQPYQLSTPEGRAVFTLSSTYSTKTIQGQAEGSVSGNTANIYTKVDNKVKIEIGGAATIKVDNTKYETGIYLNRQ